jgi:hypothetical protein
MINKKGCVMKKYILAMLVLTLIQEPLRADEWTFVEGFFVGVFTYIIIRELVPTLQQTKDNAAAEQSKKVTRAFVLPCDHQAVDSARILPCGHQYLCPVCQLEHDNRKKKQDAPRKKRSYVPLNGLVKNEALIK